MGTKFWEGLKMAEIAPKSGEFFDGKLWFTRKGSTLTVGLTSMGIEDVGSVQSLEFPSEGDDFEKGDIVVTVDGSNGKVEVITPATGVIKEINEAAQEEPDMVADDPLEEGWLFKLEIQDSSDLKEFASHGE
jgi:glycine cleavage system H protein